MFQKVPLLEAFNGRILVQGIFVERHFVDYGTVCRTSYCTVHKCHRICPVNDSLIVGCAVVKYSSVQDVKAGVMRNEKVNRERKFRPTTTCCFRLPYINTVGTVQYNTSTGPSPLVFVLSIRCRKKTVIRGTLSVDKKKNDFPCEWPHRREKHILSSIAEIVPSCHHVVRSRRRATTHFPTVANLGFEVGHSHGWLWYHG